MVRPTRADARRNYHALLAAAGAVFTEQGTDASLDVIAKRAGVGSGTLYRHFPTREALMTAVFWERIQELCAEAEKLHDAAVPVDGLTTWLGMLMELTTRRGLAQALIESNEDNASELFHACHEALDTAASPLLTRAQEDGSIRADLALADLLTFAHAIASAVARSPDGMNHARRLLDLLVNGLRTPRE
jgi:AcrR family transcriptional regulator